MDFFFGCSFLSTVHCTLYMSHLWHAPLVSTCNKQSSSRKECNTSLRQRQNTQSKLVSANNWNEFVTSYLITEKQTLMVVSHHTPSCTTPRETDRTTPASAPTACDSGVRQLMTQERLDPGRAISWKTDRTSERLAVHFTTSTENADAWISYP